MLYNTLISAKNPAPPKIFCSQKPAKNPMQKLPKNPAKTPKNPLKILQLLFSCNKNLLRFNNKLTKIN